MNKNQSSIESKTILQLLFCITALGIISILDLLLPAGRLSTIINLSIPVLYMLFILIWGIIAVTRVVHREVAKYIMSICTIEIFWLAVKYIRINFSTEAVSIRHLWYLSFFGVILVPIYFLFIALSIGHDENYRIPVWAKLLYIPAAFLISEIFSNDYNQLAFVFTDGLDNYNVYIYGPVYYISITLAAVCIIWSWYLLAKKIRIRKGRINPRIAYAPALFLLIASLNNSLTHTLIPLYDVALDIPSLFCISVVMILEIFIRSGIIQSNRNYSTVFSLSTNGVLVTDRKNNIVARSRNFVYGSDAVLKMPAEKVMLKSKKRMSRFKTRSGSIIWLDDISKLLNTIEELDDLNEQLTENIDMLQEEIDSSRRHQKLVERNRIYDLMQAQTTGRINMASELINQLEQCNDTEQEKEILSKLVILTTYIKRRNNLIFLAEDNNMLPVEELSYCIRETTDNMNVYGIKSGYRVYLEGMIPIYTAMNIYDIMQEVIKLSFDGLSSFYVSIKKNEFYTLTMRIDTTTDLLSKSDLKKYAGSDITLEQEDEDSYIVIYKTAEE